MKRRIPKQEIDEFLDVSLEEWLRVIRGKKGRFIKLRYRFSGKYIDSKARCYKSTHKLYYKYGARGLKVEYTLQEFLRWIYDEYRKFITIHGDLSPSLSRKKYDIGYTLDNISLDTISNNTKELYERQGNPTKRGTVLDEMSVLTCYTIKNPFTLSEHYKVSYSAITRILTGRNWKYLYPIFQETDL